ncbi:unnamed protein product, partial [Iphiclides podalirius]
SVVAVRASREGRWGAGEGQRRRAAADASAPGASTRRAALASTRVLL